MPIDLSVHRPPSSYRNLLEVRVGRLRRSKSNEVRLEALKEIRDIADAAIKQHEGGE